MNKRLEMLKQMTASGKADAFAWYALAMEHRKQGDLMEARTTFEKLREDFPDYLPGYLMAGQVLIELRATDAARQVLASGIALATNQGNSKALGELEEALESLD